MTIRMRRLAITPTIFRMRSMTPSWKGLQMRPNSWILQINASQTSLRAILSSLMRSSDSKKILSKIWKIIRDTSRITVRIIHSRPNSSKIFAPCLRSSVVLLLRAAMMAWSVTKTLRQRTSIDSSSETDWLREQIICSPSITWYSPAADIVVYRLY